MDEVDRIVIAQLGRLARTCPAAAQPFAEQLLEEGGLFANDANDDVINNSESASGDSDVTLSEMTAQQVYACIVLALLSSSESSQSFSPVLPASMGSRVNCAADLVASVREAGFAGDLSYHNILYPSAPQLRKLLMWLLERVNSSGNASGSTGSLGGSNINLKSDKSGSGSGGDSFGVEQDEARAALDQAVASRLGQQARESWAPLVSLISSFSSPSSSSASSASSAASAAAFQSLWFARDTHDLSTAKLRFCPPPGADVFSRVPGLGNYCASGQLMPVVKQATPHASARAPPSIIEHNHSAVAEKKEREHEWITRGLEDGFADEATFRARKRAALARAVQGIVRRVNAGQRRKTHLAAGAGLDAFAAQQDAHARLQSQFSRKVEYTTESTAGVGSEISEEDLQAQRDAELAELEDRLAAARAAHDALQQRTENERARMQQLRAAARQESERTPVLERDYKTRKATMDMLPEAEENMSKLSAMAAASKQKIKELAAEWEGHRVALVAEYRGLRSAWLAARGDTAALLAKIREMRQEMAERAAEIQAKDAQYRELVAHYKEISQRKDRTRGYYTERILDIVGSVKKQKADIDKILLDTRQLQKEINMISDTLNRTFAVTDELIFADAQKAETGRKDSEVQLGRDAKEAYKRIAALNEAFKQLVHTAEKHGRCSNAVLDLDARVQSVQEKTASLSVEEVERDLAEIRAENEQMEKQVRQRRLGIEA